MVLLEPLSYQRVSGGPLLFLAGPITAAPRWQEEAFGLIRGLESRAVVASPRRLHSVASYRYKSTQALSSFHRQRAWERYYMDLAARQGCILFWLPGPRESFEGLIYGATARYELGLWSSRWSGDHGLGLCVGGDPGFPSLGTLAYDLEKEMPGKTLHRDLEDAVREAVGVSRGNYVRWEREGSPPVALESHLVSMTHDERCLADAVAARQPGNPMNPPEALRLQALRLLRAMPDLSTPDAPEALEPEDLEELEDAENLEELEAADEGDEASRPAADPRREGMREAGSWFLAGRLVEGPKYLAVGLGDYYIPFLRRLTAELGAPVYQSGYMDWPDPGDPQESLGFYLRTAQRIDVNLEGMSAESLKSATAESGGLSGKRPIRPSAVTSWEIGRLYRDCPDAPVFWHTGGSMTHDEAFAILGARVACEFIVED